MKIISSFVARLLTGGTDDEFEAVIKAGLVSGYRDGRGVWHEPITEAEADRRIADAKYYRESQDWARVG